MILERYIFDALVKPHLPSTMLLFPDGIQIKYLKELSNKKKDNQKGYFDHAIDSLVKKWDDGKLTIV